MRRIKQAATNAAIAGAHADRTLSKADVVLDEIIDLLDSLEDGIDVSLKIGGRDIPVVIKIKP